MMNTLEGRLTAALRETGEEITGDSVPPLVLAAPPRRPRDLGGASRRRWVTRLTPLAAAAAVVAVVAVSLAISATFHGPIQRRGSAAGSSRGAPAGGPAALRKVPPYYVSLSPPSRTSILGGRRAEVRATATGAILATIRPPRPFGAFTWVSGAPDDRTFVLAAQRFWTIAPGNRGTEATIRDDTTPTRFFKLIFTSSARTARLTELPGAGQVNRSQQLAGVALSPDGTRLALDLRRSIQVITLASGAKRVWRWPGGGWVGNFKPYGQVLSWTADGRNLAFQQWGGKFDSTAHVRVLDTAAPGASLQAAKLVVAFPNKAGALTLGSENTLITPDGSKIVVGTMTQAPKSPYATALEITEFSVRTGKIVRSLDRFRFGSPGPYQDVLWSNASGTTLIVSDPRGKAEATVPGVLSGNRFTALPRVPQTNAIAW
jgi:hypothetical protein